MHTNHESVGNSVLEEQPVSRQDGYDNVRASCRLRLIESYDQSACIKACNLVHQVSLSSSFRSGPHGVAPFRILLALFSIVITKLLKNRTSTTSTSPS
jgi:hypothetical protein